MFAIDRPSRTIICMLAAALIGAGGGVGYASSPARDSENPAETKPDILRVLAWNVLHGANDVTDGPEKALAVIRESGADVVLMQESYDIDGERPKLGAWLAEQLGWNQWQGDSPHLCILTPYDIAETFAHEPWHGVGARLGDESGRPFIAWSIWLDYRAYITYELRDDPDMSDADVIALESVGSDRLPQATRIIARLKALGQLDSPIPVLVGGDWNTPSHLDWTLDTSRVYKRRRNLPLPVSLAMKDAGFTDTYRIVEPNPVQSPGLTWSPMFRMSGEKDQGFERIDRIYLKDPVFGGSDGSEQDQPAAAATLQPRRAAVYPLVWESDEIPVLERSFPSDHGAVLVEFDWVTSAAR